MTSTTHPAAVRFYFDYLSPYAYVAWARIHALTAPYGRAVEPVPVLLAAILDAHGTKGPAEVPAKRRYVFKDAYRKAHRAGLPPLVPPPTHPFNPLVALRVSSLPMDDDARRRLIGALYAATWAGGGGVESPESVARMANDVGLDGEALVRAASEPAAKMRLRQQTEQAVALGTFGVPTLIVDGQLFWGVDSLEDLELLLRGEDPVPADLESRWAGLPASATRRM
jgi:2-hydroxychromene-2-carboxylate isomerase